MQQMFAPGIPMQFLQRHREVLKAEKCFAQAQVRVRLKAQGLSLVLPTSNFVTVQGIGRSKQDKRSPRPPWNVLKILNCRTKAALVESDNSPDHPEPHRGIFCQPEAFTDFGIRLFQVAEVVEHFRVIGANLQIAGRKVARLAIMRSGPVVVA